MEWREGRWFWDEIGGKKGTGAAGNAGDVGEAKIVREPGKRVEKVQIKLVGEWEGEDGKKKYEHALVQLGEEVGGVDR